MGNAIKGLCAQVGHFFSERSISQKTLGRACTVLFFSMLVPLILIALYNYPADDDFAFTLPAATAWVQTGSLPAVLRAIYEKTYSTYMTWQGNFVSTFFFALNPLIVNLDFYFLSNWFLLFLLCASIAYLLKALLKTLHCNQKSVFWIVYTAFMILALQFMPCIGEGIFWHNGGMYTVASCTLFFTLGLLTHCNAPQTRRQSIWRGAALALCGFMLGGSFYGPALAALVLLTLLCLRSFISKSPNRFYCLLTLCFFLVSFMISVTAPGVTLRQERLGEPMTPLLALIHTALDSFDLAGDWLSPQLLAMALLVVPVLWAPLRKSPFQFRHPFWFFIMLYGLFSSSLAPGLYTGSSYGMGRYMNIIYFNFLTMAFGSLAYAEGWLIRFLERRTESGLASQALALSSNLGQRFTALTLAFSIAFLTLGGFAFTIMNTSSVNALKALVTGEAAQFRQDMKAREEYIRVTDSDVVAVRALNSQPYVFKPDKLPFQGIYGRVRYMKWYFELFYNAAQSQEVQQSSGVNHAP